MAKIVESDKDVSSRRRPAGFFLNVDLDIDSPDDLRPLVAAFAPNAYSLERPEGRASFELNQPASPLSPESLILDFVRLVVSLPPAARSLWDRASRRVFDVGFQGGTLPVQETHRLAPETLSAIAAIGAELAVTIYATDPEHVRDGLG